MDLVAEMRTLYAAYIETFNRGDYPGMLRFFAYPWALDGPHGNMLIEDAEKHLQMMEKARAVFAKAGWARSVLDKVDVYEMAGDTCMLVVALTRYRKDQSIVGSTRAYYTYRRLDKEWRIVATVEVPQVP